MKIIGYTGRIFSQVHGDEFQQKTAGLHPLRKTLL
jgi:hypothetical protein